MSQITELLASSPLAVVAVRMLLVASFVILVAVLAERMGPFLGAMVASLPLYTGPVYLMLALEHDEAWLTEATLGSVAICGATPVFVLAYCVLAGRHGVGASIGGAALSWLACAAVVQSITWSLPEALLFVAPIYAVSVLLARGFTRGVAPARSERRWSDLLLRALLCAALSGITIWISAQVPPQVSGVLSVVPILLTSIALVLHVRVGGRPTAALLAHTLTGLVGMVIAFSAVHLTVGRVGAWLALALGLAITVAWNAGLVVARRIRLSSRPEAAMPPPRPPAWQGHRR